MVAAAAMSSRERRRGSSPPGLSACRARCSVGWVGRFTSVLASLARLTTRRGLAVVAGRRTAATASQ
jgi:hypothetical protein